NIYPQELEEAIGEIEGVRRGSVAVFSSFDPASGTERLVVLAETRRRDEKSRTDITRAIEELSIDLTNQPPDKVLLAPPNTVLKTSSGKLRRAASREVFEKGLVGKKQPAPWLQILRLSLLMMAPTLRRVVAAVSASLYAAYVWTVAGLLGALAWLLIAVAPKPWRWVIARSAVRLTLVLSGISLRVSGRERLPDANVIYVVNHASYIDGPVLTLAIGRETSFVAKRELLSHWVSRILLKRLGARFVDRFDREKGISDAKKLAEDARAGAALVYFPEGTFIGQPGVLPFQMGAFIAAAESGIPVVPIAVRGTRAIMMGNSWFPRRGRIRVVIGEPIQCDSSITDTWQQALALRNQARGYILNHAGEPDMGMERAGKLAP
ncbi:MAG: 1-acyl-sn-glycerol-3-phosphate acyltransferase, partial [Rhodospirillaceae bacterium]|nr:1-acyl-sn-glycerol-3-phosphate acyltransferase [Rhodospirillaceae bacterium]